MKTQLVKTYIHGYTEQFFIIAKRQMQPNCMRETNAQTNEAELCAVW